jgi:hypothetical protein
MKTSEEREREVERRQVSEETKAHEDAVFGEWWRARRSTE